MVSLGAFALSNPTSSSNATNRTDFRGTSSSDGLRARDKLGSDADLKDVYLSPRNLSRRSLLFNLLPAEGAPLPPIFRDNLLRVDCGDGVIGAVDDEGVVEPPLAMLRRCGLLDVDTEVEAVKEVAAEIGGDFFMEDRNGFFCCCSLSTCFF